MHGLQKTCNREHCVMHTFPINLKPLITPNMSDNISLNRKSFEVVHIYSRLAL